MLPSHPWKQSPLRALRLPSQGSQTSEQVAGEIAQGCQDCDRGWWRCCVSQVLYVLWGAVTCSVGVSGWKRCFLLDTVVTGQECQLGSVLWVAGGAPSVPWGRGDTCSICRQINSVSHGLGDYSGSATHCPKGQSATM